MLADEPIITEQLVEMDNHALYMDIFGSWMEFGMAIAAMSIGVLFVVVAVKKKLTKTKNNKWLTPDSVFWNAHTRINESLTELRVKNDCARSQLIQFHNGGEFLDGISMKKMTMTHESLRSGVSSELNTKKDLLLSMCIEGLQLLIKNKAVLYITSEMDDSWCKQLLQNSNVLAFSFLPLRKHNNIIGYVMCQWCSLPKVDNIDEEDMSLVLENSRQVIEVQLDLENKGKMYNV